MDKNQSLTSVPGISVGNMDDSEAITGCTVILCEQGAIGGVDQRGGAPGTRETDLLRSMRLVQHVHAVVLAGGSAFGLDAAAGVMRYLVERDVGFDAQVAKVPIVPAAILFDLGIGRSDVYPDAEMGYQACLKASTEPVPQGNHGAGMGGTVGTMLGINGATKSGLGGESIDLGGGAVVAALVAVNALGDVVDPNTNSIMAGVRPTKVGPIMVGGTGTFANSMSLMKGFAGKTILKLASQRNTIIGVVATNVGLTKEQTNFVAQMAHDGIARAVRPAHTMLDGDTIFALSTGKKKVDVNVVGVFAAEAVAKAIVHAVVCAESIGGVPARRDLVDFPTAGWLDPTQDDVEHAPGDD